MKKIVSILLFVLLVVSMKPVQAQEAYNKKINPTFLSEVGVNIDLIPVMVQLNQNPTVVYASNTYQQKNYFGTQSFEYGKNGEDLYRPLLVSQQDSLIQKLTQIGISFQFKYRCTDTLNSLAMDVKGSDLKRLSNLPEVLKIYDDREIFYTNRFVAATTTGATRVWKGFEAVKSYTGKGVLVGIIDSGMDKTHMDKGEFAGRIVGGYNVADHSGDFTDSLGGHGTHVAGIVGGKGPSDTQRGMAYEVKFRIYKGAPKNNPGVIMNSGEAIDKAVQEKCNVINMSFGSSGPSPAKEDSYYGSLLRNAVKAGTIPVASAGNAGSRSKSKPFPTGAPAITEEAICVAATDDRPILKFLFQTEKTNRSIQAIPSLDTPNFTPELNHLEIVDCGYGSSEDFEKDVSGKIALIQRGPKEDKNKNILPISFRDKMVNAINEGALAVLVYNYESGTVFSPSINNGKDPMPDILIPVAMISKENGIFIKTNLASTHTIEFQENQKVTAASFTSMGPTVDGFFKPEITAPGTEILSTFLKGSYLPMSGTSMSSPVITGLVALLKQAYPKWDTDHVKSALMNTADILINPINNLPITFQLQGAGEARVDKAIATPAFIEPRAIVIQKDKIEPGKLDPKQKVEFTVESNLPSEATYQLSSVVYGFTGETTPLKISFDNESIKVPSLKKTTFKVGFDIDWKAFGRGTYEGVINVGDKLHIPFIIFEESVSRIPDVISGIKVSASELDLVQENVEMNMKINFSVNTGFEQKTVQIPGGGQFTNSASLEINVVDDLGEVWGTIYKANLGIGNYQILWDGKSIDGKYFLSKGKYYLQFKTVGMDYDKREGFTQFQSGRDSKLQFAVSASNVPDPTPMILSSNKTVAMNDVFEVHFILPVATDCLGVEFQLQYDAKKLMYKELIEGDFLSSDGSSVTMDEEADDDAGYVSASLMRDEKTGISGLRAKVASISFKAIATGKLKFSIKSSRILFANDSSGRLKLKYPDVKIFKTSDFLMADLNNDKTVDRYDWVIFIEAFSSKAGDENFNEICDFNQDETIDFEDLTLFSKEYGHSI